MPAVGKCGAFPCRTYSTLTMCSKARSSNQDENISTQSVMGELRKATYPCLRPAWRSSCLFLRFTKVDRFQAERLKAVFPVCVWAITRGGRIFDFRAVDGHLCIDGVGCRGGRCGVCGWSHGASNCHSDLGGGVMGFWIGISGGVAPLVSVSPP